MICVDNSSWARNGDYSPNRLDSQIDASTLLIYHRTNDNPESTVGTLSMASSRNKGTEVLLAPTNDQTKLLASLAQLNPSGKTELATALQIAQLALKHRINKAGGQRIIMFVGSPIEEDMKELTKVGTKLKKNNVAVSVIMLGEVDTNLEKLEAFVDKVNSNDNSHLVQVPPGVIPSDAIRSSPIMGDQMLNAGEGGGGGGGLFEEYGGVDPARDPELAMALRASMQENRDAEEARAKAEADSNAGGAREGGDGSSSSSAQVAAGSDDPENLTDEQAMALAQRISIESPTDPAGGAGLGMDTEPDTVDVYDEEAELARAIALSMADGNDAPPIPEPTGTSSGAADRNLGADLLAGVGLDSDDPLMAAALAQLPPPAPSRSDEPAAKKPKEGDEGEEGKK